MPSRHPEVMADRVRKISEEMSEIRWDVETSDDYDAMALARIADDALNSLRRHYERMACRGGRE